MNDMNWIRLQREGQFFERKSCYDRSKGKVKLRPIREVARDLAETLSAMANADGGSVAIGMEDDGSVTGAPYPEERLTVLREASRTHIRPPLRARVQTALMEDKLVLLFETDWSAEAHQ